MTKSVARLFEQFQPENYELELDIDRDAMKFKGTVHITGKKVGRPSQRITFHQKNLKFESASIVKHDKKGDQTTAVNRINTLASADEVRLHSEEMIYPGDYSVTMQFSGKITRVMNGIYPCFFTHDGSQKMLIATQFESHHAREAFPCIDEPEAKATYDLTVVSPEHEPIIANTPVATQKTLNGRQATTFEPTPRMSCYLLAFAFGEMGYTEGKTKDGVVVRSYATPDNVNLTQHSVNVAVRVLEFFGSYFATSYPLKKLDMIALPDFSSGAMENWGLVTYRETTMLSDEKNSSIETKQMIALVVAHELSHQWFGNLVTMKWWDDLWLNESFANMMEYRAVDELYPEWHIWEQFVSNEGASAKRRDSLLDVQSVHSDVNHPDEITMLFDPSIVYAKGGTLLHMLMHYIGEEAFRAGLQLYFKKHAYSNTVADDLWAAFAQSSGEDITGFMSGWINRPGYPIVDAEWKPGSDTVSLTQKRFLSDPAQISDDTKPWQVPLAATRELDTKVFKDQISSLKLTDSSTQPLLLNHDGHSYFLPHYTNLDHLKAISEAVKAGEVDAIDRLLLVDNYTMLQRGGACSTTELLEFLPSFAGETSESVLGSIALSIGEIRRLIEGHEAEEDKLNSIVVSLVMPIVSRLGWQDAGDDSAQTLRMRGLAISMAAGAKEPETLAKAAELFKTLQKPSDLSPTIRSVVYFCAVRFGSQADFDQLLKLHDDVKNADERDELAAALTSAKESVQYDLLLSRLTGDAIRRQDLMHWFVWILRNKYSRVAAWKWLTTHWDWLEVELASDKSFSFFPRYAGSIFSHPEELTQYNDFFGKKDAIALSRDIALGTQEIISRIAWRDRNESAVLAWLAQRP